MVNKKQDILDAYIELSFINRQNRGTISAQQVAEYVGCSKVLIFQYYSNMDELSSVCFHSICHEIKDEIRKVYVPDTITPESVMDYLLKVWERFFGYLSSNPPKAHYFVSYSLNRSPYPTGYSSSDMIVKSILGEEYEHFLLECPDFILISEYLVYVAALTANMVQNSSDPESVTEKITRIIMDGISSIIVKRS
jgi:AcrR family transcriptional regulator